ncbi:hypothetical protein IGA76_32230, partial [Pseudomonas aeruginosa]
NELSEKISASCANIEALNSRTVNIGQILEVIKGISEQTNLLAVFGLVVGVGRMVRGIGGVAGDFLGGGAEFVDRRGDAVGA